MNKYGIEVGDRFLLPSKFDNRRLCTNIGVEIVGQRYETRIEVFCDQIEQFVYDDWIVTENCPVFTVVGFRKSNKYEDVVYVTYESNSETFMCQMLADFVCKNGTRIYTKDYKNC
nr:MAG TPA: hypothetical protein [Caudoviricetes sp.]